MGLSPFTGNTWDYCYWDGNDCGYQNEAQPRRAAFFDDLAARNGWRRGQTARLQGGKYDRPLRPHSSNGWERAYWDAYWGAYECLKPPTHMPPCHGKFFEDVAMRNGWRQGLAAGDRDWE